MLSDAALYADGPFARRAVGMPPVSGSWLLPKQILITFLPELCAYKYIKGHGQLEMSTNHAARFSFSC